MSTPAVVNTLPYGREPHRLRRLPWRRIVLVCLAAYGLLYLGFRVTGRITHAWTNTNTKAPDKDFAMHEYTYKGGRGESFFMPAALLESAIRDLGPSR